MAFTKISFDTQDTYSSNIPMDTSGVYELGTTPDGELWYGTKAVTVQTSEPLVSTGTWSIGTAGPAYSNIVGTTPWGLIGVSTGAARSVNLLDGGGPVAPVQANTKIYLRVNRGLLDSGGVVRVVVDGIQTP